MRILMQSGKDASEVDWKTWDVGFCGVPLDARGRAAIHETEHRAGRWLTLAYDAETFTMKVDREEINVDDFLDYLQKNVAGSVLLEATTLGFVEILLCCRGLRDLGSPSFDLSYVEPLGYNRTAKSRVLHNRDFELSSDVPGYRAIPGNAILLGDRRPQKGVFFLGYEESRLRRAFEDLQMLDSSRSAVAFGVPAFRPGWEMDAIANNIAVVRENNLRGGVHYCGATNPAAVFELLTDIRNGLAAGEQLFVAPIGTKPHGIGTALFVSEFRDVGVIYDHPKRRLDRTEQTSDWHLYSVDDNSEAA